MKALLHIIETLQAQSEGLSEVQQRTIEELKERVKKLTDKQSFLESELLAERQKSAELKKQHEAQERAHLQQERARLSLVHRAMEQHIHVKIEHFSMRLKLRKLRFYILSTPSTCALQTRSKMLLFFGK